VIRPSDNLPDAFRPVLFSMKQGEVSEPLRQANGYYLLRAEQVSYRPFEQVRDEVFQQLRSDRATQWMNDQQAAASKIQFPSAEFLGTAEPAK
jgi:parvulin-like peptidyl-prolyl isomerase